MTIRVPKLYRRAKNCHVFFLIFIGSQIMQCFKIRKFSSCASTYHKSPILFGKYLPKIVQNWFCIQNLCKDLSFQEKKKTVFKSVTLFTKLLVSWQPLLDRVSLQVMYILGDGWSMRETGVKLQASTTAGYASIPGWWVASFQLGGT